jgi:hypothetical protein
MKVNPFAIEDLTHDMWMEEPETERNYGKWLWKAYQRGLKDGKPEFVIVAESMEPVIHSELDETDWATGLSNKRQGDPQVHYKICASVDAAKKWLDERNSVRYSGVVEITNWRQGSVGHALPGFEVVGTTGASSLRRTVIYQNEFGTHEHWQQIRVEFVEGVEA